MTLNSVVETDFPEEFVEEMEKSQDALPKKIDANPENVEKGLAKLVLTLIELITNYKTLNCHHILIIL